VAALRQQVWQAYAAQRHAGGDNSRAATANHCLRCIDDCVRYFDDCVGYVDD